KLLVDVGETVLAEQVVARVRQQELEVKIDQLSISLEKLRKQRADLVLFHAVEAQQEEEDLRRQGDLSVTMLHDYGEQVRALQERIRRLQEHKELSTVREMMELTNSLFTAQHESNRVQIQLKQFDLNRLQAKERQNQQLLDTDAMVLRTEQDLDYSRQLNKLNELKSP